MKRSTPRFSWQEVRFASLKIRGLAYLFANQALDPCPPLDLDLDQLYCGIGRVLDDIAVELGALASRGEDSNLEQ